MSHSDGVQAARLETSREPGDFSIEASRMLHIDRATDLLVAVCYGPTHARLGEKDGQPAAQPDVFYRLGDGIWAPDEP